MARMSKYFRSKKRILISFLKLKFFLNMVYTILVFIH